MYFLDERKYVLNKTTNISGMVNIREDWNFNIKKHIESKPEKLTTKFRKTKIISMVKGVICVWIRLKEKTKVVKHKQVFLFFYNVLYYNFIFFFLNLCTILKFSNIASLHHLLRESITFYSFAWTDIRIWYILNYLFGRNTFHSIWPVIASLLETPSTKGLIIYKGFHLKKLLIDQFFLSLSFCVFHFDVKNRKRKVTIDVTSLLRFPEQLVTNFKKFLYV